MIEGDVTVGERTRGEEVREGCALSIGWLVVENMEVGEPAARGEGEGEGPVEGES